MTFKLYVHLKEALSKLRLRISSFMILKVVLPNISLVRVRLSVLSSNRYFDDFLKHFIKYMNSTFFKNLEVLIVPQICKETQSIKR